MKKSVSPLRNVYQVTNVYQFRHICTSSGSADDGFGFVDPHFLFVFCNNYRPTTLIHFCSLAIIRSIEVGSNPVFTYITSYTPEFRSFLPISVH